MLGVKIGFTVGFGLAGGIEVGVAVAFGIIVPIGVAVELGFAVGVAITPPSTPNPDKETLRPFPNSGERISKSLSN
jgi:hypothetical protein